MKRSLIIGSRGSELALWQSEWVRAGLLRSLEDADITIRVIQTTGDRILDTRLSAIGEKGLFTKEVEDALLDGTVDLAVHSLKDMPTLQPDGVTIAAVTQREKPNDVLIAKDSVSIGEIPVGGSVATGSLRRRSQLLSIRPDLEIVDIRGNVPTRINKFLASDLDAMILAYAGVHRLGLDSHISSVIDINEMLPAVGQGALAIETRSGDEFAMAAARTLSHGESELVATAERSFLRSLEGGCQVPIAALATASGSEIKLIGFVGSVDGKLVVKERVAGGLDRAEQLGIELANICSEKGAERILEEARATVVG